MTEYLVITAMIAVASIAIVQVTGTTVKVNFARIAKALQGDTSSQKGPKVDTDYYSATDFGDFDKNAGTKLGK